MRIDRTPPKGVRIIVCGGRDFTDNWMLSGVLWTVHERRSFAEVIHTGQRGCAQMANRWAFEHGITRTEVRADWRKDGKAAERIRDGRMFALRPDGVIAFPGDAGTANMVALAKGLGVPVLWAERFRKALQRRNSAAGHCEPPAESSAHGPPQDNGPVQDRDAGSVVAHNVSGRQSFGKFLASAG